MQGAHRLRARVPARLLATLAVVGVLLAIRAPSAHAIPSATLAMSPSSQSLTVGDNLLVVVSVANAANVNDVALRITYDPAVVSVADYDNGTAGTQILPGWYPGTDLNYQTEGVVLANSVSPDGQINYEYQLSNNAEVSGGGTVATIQFVALANGDANVQWSWVQVKDGSGNPSTPSLGNPTIIVVGGAVPTSTPTPPVTATPTRTSTPLATSTSTPQPTATATATGSATPATTTTTTTTATPAVTNTAAPTATPRITVISNSNGTPAAAKPPASAIEPAGSGKAGGLPSAGNDGARTQWWKWSFFGGAIMLALAGWFFTFAIHAGDKEVILTDRFDRRRRRR
jgi:hypothetical protein